MTDLTHNTNTPDVMEEKSPVSETNISTHDVDHLREEEKSGDGRHSNFLPSSSSSSVSTHTIKPVPSPKNDLEAQNAEKPAIDTSESNATKPGAKAGLTVVKFWTVLVGLNIGMLLTALDMNIISPALPSITSTFSSYTSSSYLGSGFLISFALSLPLYGKLSTVFGRRSGFLFGTLIFILGSALCGWATTMDMLIWGRVVQGFGAGGIYGLVNIIITELVELREVGRYIGTIAAVWAVADVIGPLAGGGLAERGSQGWRWCFWINLCISPISLIITFFYLHLPADKGLGKQIKYRLRDIDYMGILTLCSGTVCLLLAIELGGKHHPWNSPTIIGLFIGGFFLLVIFGVIETYFAKDPLIEPSFFKSRTILCIFLAEFCYGANILGMMYYLPQFFQVVFEDSATMSGVALLPMMAGLAVTGTVAGYVTSKFGVTKINAVIGGLLMAVTSGVMARWDTGTSRAETVIVLLLLGAGQGAVMSGLLMSAQVSVSSEQVGLVTALCIFIQTVGDIFGVAVYGAVYVDGLESRLMDLNIGNEGVAELLKDVQKVRAWDEPIRGEMVNVYAQSMQKGWWLMFGFAVATLVASSVIRQGKFGDRK